MSFSYGPLLFIALPVLWVVLSCTKKRDGTAKARLLAWNGQNNYENVDESYRVKYICHMIKIWLLFIYFCILFCCIAISGHLHLYNNIVAFLINLWGSKKNTLPFLHLAVTWFKTLVQSEKVKHNQLRNWSSYQTEKTKE